MKTVGIVGGIAPASTIDYYRLIVSEYRERAKHGGYPSILIDSIDLQRLLALVESDREALAEWLAAEVAKLARAGADFAVLASNTPHLVFDAIERRSPIPLISIVESACEEAGRLGFDRLGLVGTRFTMQGGFYEAVFGRKRIQVLTPRTEEQALIHERYVGELVNGDYRPETRDRVLGIVGRMQAEDGIQGVILGGTELPLLLRDAPPGALPLLDTTGIHVRRIVSAMLA